MTEQQEQFETKINQDLLTYLQQQYASIVYDLKKMGYDPGRLVYREGRIKGLNDAQKIVYQYDSEIASELTNSINEDIEEKLKELGVEF